MKILVTAPPMIYVAPWLRRYTTALIVIALVALATLGTGVAQMLYNAAPRASISRSTTSSTLDQHERHAGQLIPIETLHD